MKEFKLIFPKELNEKIYRLKLFYLRKYDYFNFSFFYSHVLHLLRKLSKITVPNIIIGSGFHKMNFLTLNYTIKQNLRPLSLNFFARFCPIQFFIVLFRIEINFDFNR